MKIPRTCAFTGHRPSKFPWKYDETDERCKALKKVLMEQVSRLAQGGVTDYISGMAYGSDIWLSQIVLALREHHPQLKLHCALPCEGQADGWSTFAQERYYRVLRQADSITYVSRSCHEKCMLERNHFMVDHASMLLAVCANPDARRGGTAATVRYAHKAGREIILVHPTTLQIHVEKALQRNK